MSTKRDPGEPSRPRPPSKAQRPAVSDPAEAGSAVVTPVRARAAADDFPVVGVGASAGGLAAYEAFFSGMPADVDTGMAFVLVQHLAPDHKSILTELVRRYTRMEVFEVEDGMKVRPDCAYIIPPNRDMALLHGTLRLLEPASPRGLRLPIDFFFRSLAQDQHQRAICIVLSGTGSDGTLGVRAVKGEGGMVMVQSPESTEHDGMPRSAIDTGFADYVLPPAEMPAQLVAYASRAFGPTTRPVPVVTPRALSTLKTICVIIRAQTGHDFSGYKESPFLRRIDRRMAIHQIDRREDYARVLQEDPAEVETLFRELLIGVTSFFRDPDAFGVLEREVIPRLFAEREPDSPIRVWVCGCSTGEEAYSVAILLQERLEALRQPQRIQVFATDIDRRALDVARSGTYPLSIAADVTPDRLARYFARDPSGVYRVHRVVRDLLVFSEQDVIKDPPFSRLDLITCRNLLIYMGAPLQKRLMPLFHYSLVSGGTLFLGSSETVGDAVPLFDTVDRKWKVYRRVDGVGIPARLPFADPELAIERQLATVPPKVVARRVNARPDLRVLTEQTLLRHGAAVGILVTGRGDILHIHGRTGRFLEAAPGDAAYNVVAMAREGLDRDLTIALRRSVNSREAVHVPGIRVRTNGDYTFVDLTVRPAVEGPVEPGLADLFLVVLEDVPSVPPAPTGVAEAGVDGEEAATNGDVRVVALEQELRAKEEYLQATLEEMETANEELRSTNEEMQSVNEEMQSTNEELETAKEESQSINEELATVNAELQAKVMDLTRANNDMNNLLSGTGIGTVFVDHELRITRFTPSATAVLPLIPSDVGRPVGDIVSNLVGYDRLAADVDSVLASLIPVEVEVRTKGDAWFEVRVNPYRTLDNVIEGAVVTFVDITSQKRLEQQIRDLNESLRADARGAADLAAANADIAERQRDREAHGGGS